MCLLDTSHILPITTAGGGESFTWHRAIFAGGCPPTIVAAAAFHARVRDGSGWFHNAMDTRIDQVALAIDLPSQG